jgi:hypothetical protein
MGSPEILALSPGLPVDDLLAHEEGGPDAASDVLGRLVPGQSFEYVQSDTWAMPGLLLRDVVLLSTFGSTTLFQIPPARRPVAPEGMTTFSLSYQSVSMAWGVDVSGPRLHRLIALSPGSLDYAEGAPLPFEAAFADAPEASASHSFDDGAFVAAAAEWMFGCHPLDLDPDHRVDLGMRPIHAFTTVTAPAAGEVAAEHSGDAGRRSGLRGLFRRS